MLKRRTAPQLGSNLQPTPDNDTDDVGITDPGLDRSLNLTEEENGLDGTEESSDLDTGNAIAAIRNLGRDDVETELELDTGSLIDELALTQEDDDLDGPLTDSEFALEHDDAIDLSESDEADGIASNYTLDDLPELNSIQELLDDSEPEAPPALLDDASDIDIGWAALPWSELKLRSTFVACRTLNARRNVLIAAGDAIDFLSLDDFAPVDANLPLTRALYANFLENTCRSVLIAKATGQIVVWNREKADFDYEESKPFARIDHVVQVWSEPTDARIWIRVAAGQLLRTTDSGRDFETVAIPGRCVAMSANDQVMLCLVSQAQKLSLLSIARNGQMAQKTPTELSSLALARNITMIALEETLVLGARGYGLWLSSDGGGTFRKAAGCRTVTAFAIGHYLGRDYAWAALFYELEDRTEIVAIDLKSSRVQKLAEYRVMTDSEGPEDDPPERARIDYLLWDSSRHRIIAAGCFGLACFVPPQTVHASS